MTHTTMPGGWSPFCFELTEEDRQVLKTAMEGLLSVSYTPLAAAHQVVAGMNYCFLCKARAVYPDATDFAAKVYIYQPLGHRAPHIVSILPLDA
ncbi:hypothetical protein [Rubrivivax gelatinosus]|uniref:Uncharacterized protein n=1 Tax=Rubrivivax gelatinosus TaxID=28068 RepID=A0A4R2MAY8_RUBGE|nr:hypothetical protein [Rubrivivax gelatinosus]MBK1687022.1 hypothetical protein [Rubrivivax gelatinosus]TCP02205.1 hypothetical protein EV684_107211 [Rubrivivax gelatinosus]